MNWGPWVQIPPAPRFPSQPCLPDLIGQAGLRHYGIHPLFIPSSPGTGRQPVQSLAMTRVRLFHFDIPTWGNYGDKALFPLVRDLFTGFGGGQAFEFAGAAPLRREVGFELVERINATADAVVVGGGGLFLQDTNPNANSGWQWNISRAALDRLEVPIVVFAVGDNRFPGQPAFSDLFVDHVSAMAEKSVFFGLRNHGSMASMADTLPDAAAAKIEFQPCPTALGRLIYAGAQAEVAGQRRLAVQMLVQHRQRAAGYDAEAIHREVIAAVGQLAADGWQIVSTPFHPDDRAFARALAKAVPEVVERRLYGPDVDFRAGYELFASTPLVVGGRGHAQLIPFGAGSIPISLDLHNKLRYFASDVGHPELTLAAGPQGLRERIVESATAAWQQREALQTDLAAVQREWMEISETNLAGIYQALAGRPAPGESFAPISQQAAQRESFHIAAAAELEEPRIVSDRQHARTRNELQKTAAELDEARERLEEAEKKLSEREAEAQRLGGELTDLRAELDALHSRSFVSEAGAVAKRGIHGVAWRVRRLARRVRR